jgi:8-oxo-dGTP pyrophosphatase MutT (NUDIX family)
MFGGKCDPGETPRQTVLRELREESGIALDEDKLIFFAKTRSNKHHQYEYIHWTSWGGDINNLSYDRKEVEQIQWFDIKQVYDHLATEEQGWYCYSKEELSMIQHVQSLSKQI